MSRDTRTKLIVGAYAGLSYLIFTITFVYFLGWLLNFGVQKTIDGGPVGPLWMAFLVDTALVALFGLQHSIMARGRFKDWLTRYIPQPIERSTYVLMSSLVLAVMIRYWMPIPMVLWHFEHPLLQAMMFGLMLFGWLLVAYASLLINHFELFGLRQAILYLQNREYHPLLYKSQTVYRVVRHPILLGTLIAFWASPTMTVGHALFALLMTGYIAVGTKYEERDLVQLHGPSYRAYQRRVPAFVPRLGTSLGKLVDQVHLKNFLSHLFK